MPRGILRCNTLFWPDLIRYRGPIVGGQRVPVTQGDGARRAGVSPRTVSNVVNDFPLVSDELRQRVLRAISELGYQPNLVARNLRHGRSGMIGLAVPELSMPYFSELAEFVIAEARR